MRKKLNLTALLLVASVVTLSAIVLQAHNATRKHRETALALLGDYAGFAASIYKERVTDELQRVANFAVHPAHNRALPAVYPALGLLLPAGYGRQCDCQRADFPIVGYIAYTRSIDVLRTSGHVPDSAFVRELASGYRREGSARQSALLPIDSGRHFVALGPAYEHGDGDVLFGAVVRNEVVRKAVADLCAKELLPASLAKGVPTDSLLEIAVTTPAAAEVLYESTAAPRWLASAWETLPRHLGGLQLRVSVREEAAPRLIIGGLPRSRLPLLFFMLVIAAGLAGLAIAQIRRERALMRMRESFVTSVSHELRTPLAQVRLYLDTLRMGRATSPGEREWAMGHIERETRRLAHLVENVLHVSKPRPNAFTAADAIDVSAELADVVDSFEPMAKSRRVKVVSRIERELHAAIRPEHLRQLMLNLLDNAVKYGPAGQTVSIEARGATAAIELRVRDQGPGVIAAEREKIWQPYFRGSTPEAQTSGGTGIGLGIVRDLAEQYHGTVELETADRGACFVVKLPRVYVAPTETAPVLVAHSN